jgi:hypothetical protein
MVLVVNGYSIDHCAVHNSSIMETSRTKQICKPADHQAAQSQQITV